MRPAETVLPVVPPTTDVLPRADAAGTGVGHQMPTRTQHLERKQVEVLVGARGALGMSGRWCKFGRIQDDHVETSSLVT